MVVVNDSPLIEKRVVEGIFVSVRYIFFHHF